MRIPIQDFSNIVLKIKKLNDCCSNFDKKKKKKRNSVVRKNHEDNSVQNLDDLFDIVHSNIIHKYNDN